MEWSTLNTLCLGNQITVNFASEWSKDGRLYILSDSCVYVLKLTPKMTNTENVLSFTRSEIKLGNYCIADHTTIDYNDILLNLSQQNLYHHILNSVLTPNTKFTNPLVITAVSAMWSPIPESEMYKNNGLLGVVSTIGNLEIYRQSKFKWDLVFNVTESWVEHLSTEWIPGNNSNVNVLAELHALRVNSAITTCFTWTKIFYENNLNYLYIIAGHLNGNISIWKLKYFNERNEKIEIKLVHSYESNLENITAINSHSVDDNIEWITYGNLDGKVKTLIINFDDLANFKTVDIWTQKDVRVNKIISLGFDQNIGVIAIKGPFVIFGILSKTGDLKSTSHLNVGNINITGIQLISPGNYCITTTTGVIQSLKIIKTSKGYEMKLNAVLNDLKWEYHACFGVTRSPNGIIWGVLTFPCKMTDHLSLRLPIQMIFCTEKDFDPGYYFKINHCLKLMHCWECIEILRCQSAKNNTLPCVWLAKIEKFDNLWLYEVRLFAWIAHICESFIQKRSKCRKLKSTLPPAVVIKEVLLFKCRLERINYLYNKYEHGKISDFDYTSLYLIYDALINFQKGEIFNKYFGIETNQEIKRITEMYNKISIPEIPKCLWCGENLSSKPCEINHPDQRCCISGLQIPEIAKYECDKCGSPGHELLEDDIFCPLCDIPMSTIE